MHINRAGLIHTQLYILHAVAYPVLGLLDRKKRSDEHLHSTKLLLDYEIIRVECMKTKNMAKNDKKKKREQKKHKTIISERMGIDGMHTHTGNLYNKYNKTDAWQSIAYIAQKV